MYKAFALITGAKPACMPLEIKSYLQLCEIVKRGYWFLSDYYTMIRIYITKNPPHMFPKLLTLGTFILEYFKQWMEVDEINFLRSKKRGICPFPIFMGDYAISDKPWPSNKLKLHFKNWV